MSNSKETQEFTILGKYHVEITPRGKVSVFSAWNSRPRELKVSNKGNNRYVQMSTEDLGRLPYLLCDIKDHCLNGEPLTPTSFSQLNEEYHQLITQHPLLCEEDILSLPYDPYLGYAEINDDIERTYQRIDHVKKSNGWLRYHYKVVTRFSFGDYKEDTFHLCPLFDKTKIVINDIKSVDKGEMKDILEHLQGRTNEQ